MSGEAAPVVPRAWKTIPDAGKNTLIGEVGGAVWDEAAGLFWVSGSFADDYELAPRGRGAERATPVCVIAGYSPVDAPDGSTELRRRVLLVLQDNEAGQGRIRNGEGVTLSLQGGRRFLYSLAEGSMVFRTEVSAVTAGAVALLAAAGNETVLERQPWSRVASAPRDAEALYMRRGGAEVGVEGGREASDITTLGYGGALVRLKHRNGAAALSIETAGRPAIRVDVGRYGKRLRGFEALAYYPRGTAGAPYSFLIMNEAGDYAFVPTSWPPGGGAA